MCFYDHKNIYLYKNQYQLKQIFMKMMGHQLLKDLPSKKLKAQHWNFRAHSFIDENEALDLFSDYHQEKLVNNSKYSFNYNETTQISVSYTYILKGNELV